MAGSFKTPCPSCEADVLVKGPNLIGKKIDCPKCKYRFTVPNPDGEASDGFEVVETKKKGNSKALAGILLGVVGVAVLVGGGIYMFGGDPDPEPKPVVNRPNVTPQPRASDSEKDPSGKDSKTDKTGKDDKSAKSNDKKTPSTTPVGTEQKDPVDPKAFEKPKDVPVAPKVVDAKPVDPSKLKDASNLLPGQSVAIMKIGMDRLRQTPLYSAFFDGTMMAFFQNTMTFAPADIETVHFCLVDADRDPFVLIRTKTPMSLVAMTQKMDIKLSSLSPINQRDLFQINSNAFIKALSRVVSAESIRNDAGIPITDEDRKRWQEKPMAMHYYDSQTLMIGDLNIVARFLGEMDKNGDPPFQTEAVPGEPAAPADPNAPAAPNTPADPKAGEGARGGRGAAAGEQPPVAGTDPNDAKKLFSDKSDYRTIRPELKQLMNRLESDEKNKPCLCYVDILNHRIFPRSEREIATNDVIMFLVSEIFPTVQKLGIGINQLQKNKMTATVLTEYLSDSDLKNSIEKSILPFLVLQIAPMIEALCGTKVTVLSQIGDVGNVGGRAGAGNNLQPVEDVKTNSKITVTNSDNVAAIEFDIEPFIDNYNLIIQPAIVDIATQMKGRMAVLSGETSWYSLSTKYNRVLTDKKQFPTGTLARESKPERFGQPYPPDHRASFIVDLLPYLSKGGVRSTIEEKKYAWYDKRHHKAASTWIPELLVPYYPQSAWRAFHDQAVTESGPVTLGATNFVALAGLGRNAARFNPGNPEHAKLVGITGYDWGSKPAEITDGLSNTIYMIQVPPGHNRPWIAGGGATVMGVSTTTNPIADFIHTEPSGKRGTYALMADGSVRHLPDTVDGELFKSLVTRAGGETVADLDKKLPKLPVPKGMEAELKGGGGILAKILGGGKKDDRASVDAPELQKLQGKWKVNFQFKDGKSTPVAELDKLDMRVVIEDNRMTIETKSGSAGVIIKQLDPKTTPKQITFQNETEASSGTATFGVYILDDKKLRIRYVKNAVDTDRPSEIRVPEAGGNPQEGYMELTKILD